MLSSFEQELESSAKRDQKPTLLIAADGILAKIPWAVLENSKGKSLIERYSIVQILRHPPRTSAQSPRVTSTSPALVLADPALAYGANEFPPLADALQEGRRVARRFDSPILLEGNRATGTAFTTIAPRARLFHFAGHGVSNGGMGGLLLAGEDGFLSAEQISKLDLRNMNLAVLSSCSGGVTAETRTVAGDLLVRGFLDAGAARVLAASWPVDSFATSKLMDRFYAGLLQGESAASSLRGAMLQMRSEPGTAHPSDWAAFQLYGLP